MKTRYIIALCPVVILSVCASIGATYKPIIDGVQNAYFQSDLQACQSVARDQHQLDQETFGSAAAGSLLGAAVAEAGKGSTAVEGAIGGALVGLVGGVTKSKARREMIIVDSMKGRGHRVVG